MIILLLLQYNILYIIVVTQCTSTRTERRCATSARQTSADPLSAIILYNVICYEVHLPRIPSSTYRSSYNNAFVIYTVCGEPLTYRQKG